MAELTGGELVAKRLEQAGVNHIFTLCGGHSLPIYEGCLTHGIRIIHASGRPRPRLSTAQHQPALAVSESELGLRSGDGGRHAGPEYPGRLLTTV